VKEISKIRLIWAEHVWRKERSLLRTVIENAPLGKRQLGRPRLRWGDRVKEDVEKVKPVRIERIYYKEGKAGGKFVGR